MSSNVHIILEILLWLVCILVVLFGGLWKFLDKSAEHEISTIPKVPMNECDKHGLYPKDAALHTTAEMLGQPDLDIEICPFCWHEREQGVKETLHKMEKTKKE